MIALKMLTANPEHAECTTDGSIQQTPASANVVDKQIDPNPSRDDFHDTICQ